jgi:hypothetical protein
VKSGKSNAIHSPPSFWQKESVLEIESEIETGARARRWSKAIRG